MNIGAVAKLTGLSSKSIRLYEDKGSSLHQRAVILAIASIRIIIFKNLT